MAVGRAALHDRIATLISQCTSGLQMANEFIKFVRHAVAHGNVEAEAEGKGSKTVTHLVLWNIPPGTDKENWRIRSSIEGIRWIAVYLTKLIN